MRLVVQIPALNEEKTIATVIGNIPKDIPGIDEILVVVVDDGSRDRTVELARSVGADVVSHPERRGVGAAFRSGIARAIDLDADIVVTIDADGQFNTEDILKLVAPIIDDEADFVTASRFADKDLIPEMPAAKVWGNNFMARWVSRLARQRFYDVSCGFRAYSRRAYLRLVLLGDYTYTHETFLSLAFAGLRIKEIPVKVRGVREFGKSRVASNLLKYGWRTALIILKTYRDYKPLRFFSYIAGGAAALALLFFSFALWVKLTTGYFTPHKWAALVAAVLLGAALAIYLVGMVAEMLDRIRVAQDEILFRVRRLDNERRRNEQHGEK